MNLVRQVWAAVPALVAGLLLAWVLGLGVGNWKRGWKSPTTAVEAEWCDEHRVPEAVCVECRHDLAPHRPRRGWCEEHGTAECPLCDPTVAELATTAAVSADDRSRLSRARAVMSVDENSRSCKLGERRIQLGDEGDLRLLKIATAVVERRPVVDSIFATGEVVVEPTHHVALSARVAGNLVWVRAAVGQKVEAGETLALVESPQVAQARAEYAQAEAKLTQASERQAQARRAIEALRSPATTTSVTLRATTAETESARVSMAAARRACALLGIDPDEAAGMSQKPIPSRNVAPVRTPIAGVITEVRATPGEAVEAGKPLITVVDPAQTVIRLTVAADLAPRLRIGQAVRFQPTGSETPVTGSIRWIAPALDPVTHTVIARVALDPSAARPAPHSFGRAEIILREESDAITVPSSAIHHEGCCTIVFTRDRDYQQGGSKLLFHVRKVRVGTREDGYVEILAGLLPGEVVATDGSGQFRSELLKSGIGQGCACGH